ncbi:GTP cyclohydrolase II [Rhodothalassium salexigens]|nr:GTP cyclohydrolase II [Rhodothalassium salexigens]MBK5921329.1 GTP cyclohydrolase II [Rhodothalassium salexigens]
MHRVARAQDDLRRWYPVRVTAGSAELLMLPAGSGNPAMLAALSARLGPPHPVITRERAAVLKIQHKGHETVRLAPRADRSALDLAALADATLDLATPLKGPFTTEATDADADRAQAAALTLLKRARLLPAALIWPAPERWPDSAAELTAVEADAVARLAETGPGRVHRIAEARLPVAHAPDSRLIGYRPTDGGPEHFALVIGQPDRAAVPLVRLHSECFTGDLLGSLKCDCGDQLRGAVQRIGEAGWGALLYLAQEGRGIGLMSKVKAYALQDQGHDTVDANLRLGFGVDERLFDPAAAMLRDLGMERIRLLTNNPAKVAGLEALGLDVAERVPHAFATNPHNEAYLATKRDKTGHYL